MPISNFFTALSVSDDTVMGSVNDTLTLPYTYSVHKYTHSVCWGRGRCTLSGCNDVILQTDGSRVTWRTSDRYQLLGNIPQGDVSLTITGVTEEDEGTYCCKVEIPGWFNDLMREVKVWIQERPSQGEIPVFHTDVKKQPTTMRQEMFYTHRNISYIPTMLPLEKTTLTLQKTESSSLSNYQVYRIAGYVTLILMIYLVMILYRLTRTHG
ncbi:hepatitis A virus cellular receptor 1 homolog isoform X2 [Mixophyes fleayi]|uniref:hepatitis A virus cellular receptor 1 homolog isoform X2 n=1 Tax=Mixophyes fleayi TaxID=3061075 RepID=UPI003F4E191F